jgi:multidrug efflux pump
VVDDAIVVLENVTRHMESGMSRMDAAIKGASEVGFTVLSMSVSLIAVFIPILLMGGIVGRLFREFAVTLSVAIMVSLVLSLTTTPMMCAWILKTPVSKEDRAERRGAWAWLNRMADGAFTGLLHGYEVSLGWALRHGRLMLAILAATIALNIYLYVIVPKGFFPQQDTGRLTGFIQADQSISFQAMRPKLAEFIEIVRQDPAVETVMGFTGGGQRNTAFMFVSLKPLSERKISAEQVIARLRVQLAHVPGANLFLNAFQDIRVGGRSANAQYQFTLQADDLAELRKWEPDIRRAVSTLPLLADVNTDSQDKGLQTSLVIDRDSASRLGITPQMIDTALNNAFGQRQVSNIYNALNQYHVVMEAAPPNWQSPESLNDVYVIAPGGIQVPLASFARFEPTNTPLAVNHQSQFAASTISFNLPLNVSLSEATDAVQRAMQDLQVPGSIIGRFQGTARAFQDSLASQPWLILTALIAVYIVLGILYESTIHPVTILSTLPSAGIGALLALLATGTELSSIALIGVILLIGIVKKNAIMMIDFALAAERNLGLAPREAIFHACLKRFRPIMMTTLAALLGAIPLAFATGEGTEMRRPLGIAIVGGLILSQILTLYTTPVVYLYLDRLRQRGLRRSAAKPSPGDTMRPLTRPAG